MKQIILTLIVAFSQNLFGQNTMHPGKIEYDMYLNLANVEHHNAVLFFNNDKSIFYWNNIIKKKPELEQNDEGNFNINIEIRDSIGTVNYLDLKKDSLFTRTLWLKGTKYIVNEKSPKIKWVLFDETKNIGNISCKKAIGDFRGRLYTAWYSLDIPVPFGPWKLQGLPGIIIEAYDESKEVQFILKSIKTPFLHEISLSIFEECKKITIQQFAIKQNEILDEIIKGFMSKLPRGVTATIDNRSQNFLEKKFEFNASIPNE